MSERRRAGAMVIPKGRPPADKALLQPQSIVALDHQTDSWRVLRFVSVRQAENAPPAPQRPAARRPEREEPEFEGAAEFEGLNEEGS